MRHSMGVSTMSPMEISMKYTVKHFSAEVYCIKTLGYFSRNSLGILGKSSYIVSITMEPVTLDL